MVTRGGGCGGSRSVVFAPARAELRPITEQAGPIVHRRPGQPAVMLLLRQMQQRQHRALLPAGRVFGDMPLRPFEVLRSELETVGLDEIWLGCGAVHRSISPKTMSIEPMIATRSASIWPR